MASPRSALLAVLRAKERREVTEGLEDIWSVLRHVIDADGRLCLGIVGGMGTDVEYGP